MPICCAIWSTSFATKFTGSFPKASATSRSTLPIYSHYIDPQRPRTHEASADSIPTRNSKRPSRATTKPCGRFRATPSRSRCTSAAATAAAAGTPKAATMPSPKNCSDRSMQTRFCSNTTPDRAGGFEPLRLVPRGKNRRPRPGHHEGRQARIATMRSCAASRKPRSMCRWKICALSPQCGFASVAAGNLLSMDDQWREAGAGGEHRAPHLGITLRQASRDVSLLSGYPRPRCPLQASVRAVTRTVGVFSNGENASEVECTSVIPIEVWSGLARRSSLEVAHSFCLVIGIARYFAKVTGSHKVIERSGPGFFIQRVLLNSAAHHEKSCFSAAS